MFLSFLVSSLPSHYLGFALFHRADISFLPTSFPPWFRAYFLFFLSYSSMSLILFLSGYICLKGIFMILRNSSREAEIQ